MLTQAAVFLLDSLIGLFSLALLLRFYMQAFRAPFRNQIGVFVVQVTNWLVMPLRKVFPGVFALDLASFLAAYIMQVLLIVAVLGLSTGLYTMAPANMIGLILWSALLATFRLSIYLLIGALFIQAILSWVSPYSPLMPLSTQLTRPFTDPIRRLVPPIANIDLSPLIAILLAQVILIFLR
jgi:YggT family protein